MNPGMNPGMNLPVRAAAVAGSFYPAEAARLRADVQALLRAASDEAAQPAPKAVIAPHAGYVYSGATAARAYARLAALRGTVTRVVLLGPAHRVHVRGIALPEAAAFDTPLGAVEVDQEAVRALAPLRQVVAARPVHAAEHALEVHLPFLIETLAAFKLVPLVVGEITPAMVAEVLNLLWGGPETLIVVSTDLSHYHAYRDAVRIDGATVAAMAGGAVNITHEQACGATPVNALMQVARERGMRIELIDQCNSGDTAGARDRVVGYAALALYESEQAVAKPAGQAGVKTSTGTSTGTNAPTSTEASTGASAGAIEKTSASPETVVPQWFPVDGGAMLTSLARAAIERALGVPPSLELAAPWLAHTAAVFVTLTRDGALRGCIGSLLAHRALGLDVAENAVAAALRDPRFAPLTAQELPALKVEVSLLTAPQPMLFVSEADALAQLRPPFDGVIFEAAGRRSTFLPQVWEQIAAPHAFLAALKEKAGLPAVYWGTDVRLSRYWVAKFSE